MKARLLIKERRSLVSYIILLISGFIFASCSMNLSSVSYDDVYSDSDDDEYLKEYVAIKKANTVYQDPNYKKQTRSYREAVNQNELVNQQSESDSLQDETEYGYIEYDEDDYYDYAYSARLRRFHSPFLYADYYSDYYTNLYWYTYDPFYWGTSIYLGYHWWYPSYYHRWYDPFCWSWHSPYWHHHHHHHHHHYDVCYYNSHDYNSNLYRRMSTGQNYITRATKGISKAGSIEGTKLVRGLNTSKPNMAKPGSSTVLPKGNTISRNSHLEKPSRLTTSKPTTSVKKPGVERNNKTITNNRTGKSKNYNPPTQGKRVSPSTTRTNRQINRSNNGSTYNRNSTRPSNRSSYRSSSSSRSTYSPSRSSGSRSMGGGSRSSSSGSSGRISRR